MPTAVSSTERAGRRPAPRVGPRLAAVRGAARAVADVGILLRFRAGTVTHRGRTAAIVLAVLAVTCLVAVAPAYGEGAGLRTGRALDVAILLPSALAGVVVLAMISAAASGGGRELLPRDAAAVHPVSPTTDHLGALLLAPLNVAWMLQFWSLLATTAYAMGPAHLLAGQLLVVVWMALATAVAQVLAWTLESVRRVPRGIGIVRLVSGVFFGVALGLQLSHELVGVLDALPTRRVVLAMQAGVSWSWAGLLLTLVAALVAMVALGAVPAHLAAHRLPRDELRVESGTYAARRTPRTALGMLVRLDRASVWRAVPMRRGVLVLALGPGVVALLGGLQWPTMTVLPGLVASGGALLYGVNAWCLDGRGALWRASLPVAPGAVFDARAIVLAEFLTAASLLTVAVAAVRAGMPGPAELAALVASMVVVTTQVVGASMRWSARRPFAVDLRSARATPAPPAVMVAYSSRLAVSTTVTGVVFSWLARVDAWELSVLVALPCLAWSLGRLAFTRRDWLDPQVRARVVTTVAA